MSKTKTCQQCASTFQARRSTARFCPDCRTARRNGHTAPKNLPTADASRKPLTRIHHAPRPSCPVCRCTRNRTTTTNTTASTIERWHACQSCGHRFRTWEQRRKVSE